MDSYDALDLIISNAEIEGYLESQSQEALVMMAIVNLRNDDFQMDSLKSPPISLMTLNSLSSQQRKNVDAQDYG